MPLVTSSSVQGNLFRQSSAPATATTGDVWVDTDDGSMHTYDGSDWIQQTVGALGSGSQILRVNAGATALEYAAESNDYELLGVSTLGADAASMSVGSLTTTNYDFIVVYYRVEGVSSTSASLRGTVNNDTTAAEYTRYRANYNGAISSDASTDIILQEGTTTTTRRWGMITISNISGELHDGYTIAQQPATPEFHISGFRMATNTASITSVEIKAGAGNLLAGSKMLVYGVRNT